jgi:hypothetical protein
MVEQAASRHEAADEKAHGAEQGDEPLHRRTTA